jgi:hypothetical protein
MQHMGRENRKLVLVRTANLPEQNVFRSEKVWHKSLRKKRKKAGTTKYNPGASLSYQTDQG